ncbi:major facilitator superfamily domain-containing protein [Lentinula aciculospora]|uniref:Major facilitator superfamily domain-containing protein n=1 Tax=Lentinula aciculospora TaxID=153920 RepID=A0A9W9AKA9_9AGAR|nr:major facilitator superfamily domain-containing protein [Lentinula aciculospora]
MSTTQNRSSGELKLLDPEKRPLDEDQVRRVLRKIDYHILPIVVLLYLLAFLDRGNVGNAKILGMVEDAHLTGLRYNILSAVFFVSFLVEDVEIRTLVIFDKIPYSLGEVPSYVPSSSQFAPLSNRLHSNIMLKVVRPSRWLAGAAVAWGTIVTLMCLCNSFNSLLITRLFVGLTESALSPGILFYLSTWYPRRYLAWRVGVYVSATVLAGAFSGLLAYGIERMDKLGGLHGWQWIFGLEGIVTVLVGLISLVFIHDSVQSAKFLTISEKDYLQRAIARDSSEVLTHLDKKFIWLAFKDYRTYLHSLCLLGIMIPLYSLALFLPTLVYELGYRAIDAQLFTVPPYALACVCTLISAYLSDRWNLRGPFVIITALLGIAGFILLLCSSSSTLGYIAMFFATSGVFSADAVFCTWFSTAYSGETKRAVAIAIINGAGNLGGVLASFVYINPENFYTGYSVNIGCLVVTILLTGFMMWEFNRDNRLKEKQCDGKDITVELKAEWKNMGDRSPLFSPDFVFERPLPRPLFPRPPRLPRPPALLRPLVACEELLLLFLLKPSLEDIPDAVHAVSD